MENLVICKDCGREYDLNVENKDNRDRCDLCVDKNRMESDALIDLLEEVKNDYYDYMQRMECNEYYPMMRVIEIINDICTYDTSKVIENINIKANGDLYLYDVKLFNIHRVYGVNKSNEFENVIVAFLKDGNAIGNLTINIYIEPECEEVTRIWKFWNDKQVYKNIYIAEGWGSPFDAILNIED